MPAWWPKYGKVVASVLMVAVTAIQAALSDGRFSTVEDVQIVIAIATAIGVYWVPLHPTWPWSKTFIAVLLAVLNVALTLILSGWVSSDWTALILAALTAVGVGSAPAQSLPTPPAAHAPPGS